MRNAKKWTAVLIAGAMCLGMMAGCGNDQSSEPTKGQETTAVPSGKTANPSEQTAAQQTEGTTQAQEPEPTYDLGGRKVVFAHWGDISPNPESETYADQIELIGTLEEKYNCVLEFETPNDWHTYRQQILLSAMSNDKYADAFWLSGGDMGLWVTNGFLTDLDGYIDMTAEQWNQEFNDMYTVNGKHYFASDQVVAMGRTVLFNKRLCEENGITSDGLYELQRSGGWNWDKLLEFAQKCTKSVNGEYVSYGLGAYGSCPVMPESFMISNGVTAAKYDENRNLGYSLEDPAVMEALQFSYDLVNKYKVCYSGATDWGTWEQLWKEGKTAFFMCDGWQMDMYYEPLAEDEFGILMLPKGPSADDYNNFMALPAGVVMPSTQEDPEAVGALIDDYFYPYEWKKTESYLDSFKDKVFDDGSLESISMAVEPGRTIIQAGDENSWFQGNILWSDFGILTQTPPRTWVTERRAEIEKAFADANILPDKAELEAEVNGTDEAE